MQNLQPATQYKKLVVLSKLHDNYSFSVLNHRAMILIMINLVKTKTSTQSIVFSISLYFIIKKFLLFNSLIMVTISLK